MYYKTYLYGGLSGIGESCVSHPIDYYKIKYQNATFNNKKINAMFPFLINNIKNKGVFSIYKGFIPKITGVVPSRFVFWGVQNTSIDYFSNIGGSNTIGGRNISNFLLSGSIAGFFQTIVETPAETLKIQLMTNKNRIINYKLTTLYRGFLWHNYRNMAFCSMVCTSNNLFAEENEGIKFLINGITAFIACIITQPFDFMKTKYQSSMYVSLSFKEYIKKYTWNVMNGFLPRAYAGFLNMGIGAFIFNTLNKI